MAISADILLDRLKLKSRLQFWRLIAIVAIFILIFSLINKPSYSWNKAGYIAHLTLDEVIYENLAQERLIDELASNDKVKAVILHINSPGGTEAGAEILYNALKNLSARKPLVVTMGTVAASGGYMAALAADYILARHTTATGSIGVVLESSEYTELAKKLGISFTSFKSSPLKAAPSPFEKLTPEVNNAIHSMLADGYHFFVKLVAERRKLTLDEALKISDGRVYSGNQAKELKLIDDIGGSKEAIKWLETAKSIPADLPIQYIELSPKEMDFARLIASVFSLIQSVSSSYSMPNISNLGGMLTIWRTK